MKFLKGLFTLLLVLIIVGGLGYLGYMFLMPGMNHSGMNQIPNTAQTPNTDHGTNDNQNVPNINVIAIQNKDKLSQAVATVNQAIEMITTNPYINVTVPNGQIFNMQEQQKTTDSVNIYPSGNGSVNINPAGTDTQQTAGSQPANNIQIQPGSNFVYDQIKLTQVNNAVFKLSQGMALLNILNEDLTSQTALIESNPPTYQTYVLRYSNALQNRTRLNTSSSLLSEASTTLINMNPYASPKGYEANAEKIAQLQQGIYKLGQGTFMLTRLNADFTNQMMQSGLLAQSFTNAQNGMFSSFGMNHGSVVPSNTMTHSGLELSTIFNFSNLPVVFNIILILLVISLIVAILGGIFNMFKSASEEK